MEHLPRDKSIRVLVLIPTFPYPPHDGFNLRVWNLYRLLSRKVDLTLLCGLYKTPSAEALQKCTAEGLKVKTVQFFQRSRAAEFVKKLGFLLDRYPVWTAGFYSPEMKPFLEGLLQRQKFDIIAMESTWLARYWPLLEAQPVPKILVLHDLDAEKWRRQADLLPLGRQKLSCLYNASGFRHVEDQLLRRAHLTFVTSKRERVDLLARNKNLCVEIIPNGVDSEALQPLPVSGSRELLFVGSLSYLPNTDGVLFFAREVMPELYRRFPDLRCVIVGKKTPAAIRSLDGVNGVEVAGEVPDLEPYYRRCAVSVVPIRAGSGTRLKILEAMAWGRPVVSTTLGCEGLDVKNREHLLIADRPDEIAKAIGELLTAPELSQSIVHNARNLVENKYSWSVIVEKVYQNLLKLV